MQHVSLPFTNRGVWLAPWTGAAGELVVFVMMSNKQLVTGQPITIPHGADRIALSEELWALLEKADPEASSLPARPPRFGRLARERLRLNLLDDRQTG